MKCVLCVVTDSKNAIKKFIQVCMWYVSFRYFKVGCRVHQQSSINTATLLWTHHESESLLFVCLFVWLWIVLLFFSARVYAMHECVYMYFIIWTLNIIEFMNVRRWRTFENESVFLNYSLLSFIRQFVMLLIFEHFIFHSFYYHHRDMLVWVGASWLVSGNPVENCQWGGKASKSN